MKIFVKKTTRLDLLQKDSDGRIRMHRYAWEEEMLPTVVIKGKSKADRKKERDLIVEKFFAGSRTCR